LGESLLRGALPLRSGGSAFSSFSFENAREQVAETEFAADDDLAREKVHRLAEDRTVEDEGVKLAVLATRVHGGGRSRRKLSSSIRPANAALRTFRSTQTTIARNPAAKKSRMSSRVSRFQRGKRPCIPIRARCASRYRRTSSRKISPKTTERTPRSGYVRSASAIRTSYTELLASGGMKTS
jgi:hypothetical protein